MSPDRSPEPPPASNGIEEALLDALDLDERLQSGVPEAQRATDLDYIQMTGLGRPTLSTEEPLAPPPSDPSELDARRPLSFFEKGVADVDASMGPPALDADDPMAEVLAPPSGRPQEEPLSTVILPDAPSVPSDRSAAGKAPGPDDPSQDLYESPPLPEPAPEDDLAELSQAVERLKAAPKPTPPASEEDWRDSEPITAASAEPPPSMQDLAEAERLLQELEHQPRDFAPRSNGLENPAPGSPVNDNAESDAAVYNKPPTRHGRRSSSHYNRLQRRLMRWVPRWAALLLVAGGTGVAYWQAMPLIERPSASFDRAEQLKAAGRYEEASEAFARFAADRRDDPRRADAEFQAAYCLQLAPAATFDETQALKKRTLALFERFVSANPAHVKTARARVRMGLLYFDLGEFGKSVEILQDPSLALADPESALPALRALARARWKMGDYDAAESAYLQAAVLAGNYTPDRDYEELGDLNRWRCEHAEDEAARERHRAAAIEHWTKAMRVSTIDPAAREKIRKKCDWLSNQTPGRPAAAEKPAPAPETTPPSAPEPHDPSPDAEAQYLGNPPASEAPPASPPPSEHGEEHATPSHS
ncbi:MAG TPA: hypothetical protein P5318_05865 [Candidatus Hydrogenedentes bacterium]|nr:hypothetical protein [Candidatus Hydrogenedentota bacterium]HRT19636.1 hypothetical protein [Candidatus Hydrogenedentota bacterium]HRT64410.1 hypothetical protein [Candidatus Hydrogenedentota bacterium]